MTNLERCPYCGELLPNPLEEKVTFSYWTKCTYPYSIDQKPEGGKLDTLTVPLRETFVKGGKRYYRIVSGHGEWTDALILEECGEASELII